MHLFYVVDALDIKKIEKKKIFLYVPIFFRFFPLADLIPIAMFATLRNSTTFCERSHPQKLHSISILPMMLREKYLIDQNGPIEECWKFDFQLKGMVPL